MRLTPICMCLAGLLTGCAVSTARVDTRPDLSYPARTSYDLTSAKWMRAHHDEIVARARDYIQSAHPTVDADFPRIHVRQVSFYDDKGAPLPAGNGQQEMADVLQSLSDGILGGRSAAPIWQADVEVRSGPQSAAANIVNGVLLVPDIWLCFSTVFVICPGVASTEVVMVTHLTRPDGSKLDLVAGGSGAQVESTLMLEDSPDSEDTLYAKSLSAAIVGIADQLVEAFKSGKH
jgi:hypothetical protein